MDTHTDAGRDHPMSNGQFTVNFRDIVFISYLYGYESSFRTGCAVMQGIISWNLSKTDTLVTTVYRNMFYVNTVRGEVNKNCVR